MTDLSQNALHEIAGGDCSGATGTVCDMAKQMRARILAKISEAIQCGDPFAPVEIDGQKTDFNGYLAALQRLLQWTYDICLKDNEEDGADVVITSPFELLTGYLCGSSGLSLPTCPGLTEADLSWIASGDCSGLVGTPAEIVAQMRPKILAKINEAIQCGDAFTPIEVGGQKVDYLGYVAMLQRLLQWTYDVTKLENEEAGANVVITSPFELASATCCDPITSSCATGYSIARSCASDPTFALPSDLMYWKGVFNPTTHDPPIVNGGGRYGDTYFVPAGLSSNVDFGSGPISVSGPALLIHNGISYVVYQTDGGLNGADLIGEGPLTLQAGDITNGYLTVLNALSTADNTIVQMGKGPTLVPGIDYTLAGAGTRIVFAPSLLSRLLAGDTFYIRRLT